MENTTKYKLRTSAILQGNYSNFPEDFPLKPGQYDLEANTIEEILEKQLAFTLALFARYESDQNGEDNMSKLKEFGAKYKLVKNW